MTYLGDKRNEQQDSLHDVSLEVSRERVQSLWRQILNSKSSAQPELAAARASRAKAEVERQRISNEALQATREACRQIIAESERQLTRARQAEAEAEQKLDQAEKELKQAQTVRSEADSHREKSINETQQDAQRIREEARSAATQECEELKRHVTYEVQRVLAEVDGMRAAAQGELEAQRIYADAANMKAMSQDVWAQVMKNMDKALSGSNGPNGDVHSLDGAGSWEVVGAGENDSLEPQAEQEESVAGGQHQNGMPSYDVESTEKPKRSHSKTSK